jgi:hypothetical protein
MVPISIIAHIFGGIGLLICFLLLLINYTKIQRLDIYQLLVLCLLFSSAITLHGLSHLGLEQAYKYNPLLTS